jgi:[acyl-carrier-protein] S-malonyltransferase
MSVVFMFPGQSSKYPGMIKKLMDRYALARKIISDASDVLGRNLGEHFSRVDADVFSNNQDIQIGVFFASYLHSRLLVEHTAIKPALSLGLSLGEYNHLVDIGALAFEEALQLVAARGRLYDSGPAGIMASVSPVSVEDLRDVLTSVRHHGPIEISNYNSPTQQVIAGSAEAVEAAIAVLTDELFAVCSVIEHRIPMHTSVFTTVSEQFRPCLQSAKWNPVCRPYLPNVKAQMIPNPSRECFVDHLAAHVHRPALWRQSIEAICARDPDAIFVEVGPRSVLFNLLQERWVPNRKFKTDADLDGPPDFDLIASELGSAGVVA